MTRSKAALAYQRGQAMVEMVAMSGVATLLFLGIWYIGKYHDIQASTIQAARYLAWERTVHSPSDVSDPTLQLQTRARLFTFNQNAYKATDSKPDGSNFGRQSSNWDVHSNKARLVDRPNGVITNTRVEGLPGLAAAAISEALALLTKVGGTLTSGEALPRGGMYTGTVTVAVNNVTALPAPLNTLNLKLKESHSVLTNSWDANGPEQAANRTRPFAPASALTQLNPVLKPLFIIVSVIEPDLREFKPGQICPDIVPNDRVEGNNNLPAYAGAQKCY